MLCTKNCQTPYKKRTVECVVLCIKRSGHNVIVSAPEGHHLTVKPLPEGVTSAPLYFHMKGFIIAATPTLIKGTATLVPPSHPVSVAGYDQDAARTGVVGCLTIRAFSHDLFDPVPVSEPVRRGLKSCAVSASDRAR